MAAEESQALVRFVQGWVRDGVSEDGMPRYTPTIRIIKSVPPYTEVEREATDQDIEENPGPFQLFEKEQAARRMPAGEAGFPLALWPVVSPAHFKMLADRDIVTVEQLAKITTRNDLPGDLKEIADRAKQMIALMANLGKFEDMLRDRESQLAALNEQVTEMRATISAQNSLISSLKQKAA